MLRPLLLAGLALSVAACNRSDEGTSVTINADGGTVMGAIDGETGEMKIDIPGLKGAVTLPKIKLDSGDFDLNGVRLQTGNRRDVHVGMHDRHERMPHGRGENAARRAS